MAFQKIQIRPGINVQATPTLNEGGLSSGNLIRFRQGLLEKIGGWLQFSPTPTIGVARGLHAWADLSSNDYLGVGTNERLQIYTAGTVNDITPIRKTSNLSTPFTTTSTSSLLQVTDTLNGTSVGDWIYLPSLVYVDATSTGVIIQGYYKVASVIDSDNYTINIGTVATVSGATGIVSKFTTTNTTSVVKVTLANSGTTFPVGYAYNVAISTVVGGLTIAGVYLVNSVVDANNFNITVSGSATSSTNGFENGGNVRIVYLLATGNVSDTVATGYGTGPYGIGAYGVSSGSSFKIPARLWFLDNFGQNLVALPTGGTLYQWTPPVSTGNVAVAVTNAPLYGNGMFVAMPQEQVFILGAEVSSVQDPMLIRWCDAGIITSWTATVVNQAGSYRLSRGSKIIGGLQGPQFGLIWTDLDLWVASYIQYPLVYGFNIVGEQVGLISPKGANLLNNTAYWMSLKGFFQYSPSGGVVPIPCTVWDWIFDRLDTNNVDKIFAAPNSLFNEMAWFFPSTDATNPTPGEIDSYGKMNIAEGLWDYGMLTRFSWIDQSIFGPPLAADGSNLIEQHEIGYDANGVAMADVFAQTGYVDIADGEIFIFVDWIVPDFKWKTTQPTTQPRITITVYTVYTPGDPVPSVVGPFTVTPTTPYFSLRTRARQMAIRIESDTIDTFWRVGSIRYRGAPSGRV